MKGVRQAIVSLTPQLLGEFLRSGERHLSIQGLPMDAKFIGAWYNHIKRCFEIIYESKEFDLVEDGQERPILEPPTINRLKEKSNG